MDTTIAAAVSHRLIGGNECHHRRSSGNCEGQYQEQQYLFHGGLPMSATAAAGAIRYRWLRDRDDRQAEPSGKDEAKSHNEEKRSHDRVPSLTLRGCQSRPVAPVTGITVCGIFVRAALGQSSADPRDHFTGSAIS